MKKSILIVALMSAISMTAQNQLDFTTSVIDPTSNANIGIDVADIDNDTDLDIITVIHGSSELAYYKNESNTNSKDYSFTKVTIDNIDGQYIDVKDINEDSFPEILCSVPLEGEIILYLAENAGDTITWTKDTVTSNFNGAHQVHLVDMDNDGDFDVLAAGNTSNKIQWWEKSGENWIPHLIAENYGEPQSVEYFDFNNDSYPDIVSGQMLQSSGFVNIWFSNYTDSLTYTKDTLSNNVYGVHWFDIADINGDGLEDILGAGFFSNKIAAWTRDAENSYTFTQSFPVNSIQNPLHVATADLDNDGDLDILAPERPSSNHKMLYFINDNQVFDRNVAATYFTAAWQVVPFDFDGDTDMDFVAGACSFASPSLSEKLTLFENTLLNEGTNMELRNDEKLLFCYPNPCESETSINFTLQNTETVSLDIFTLTGEKICNLMNEQKEAGTYSLKWNGRNSIGKHVPAGLYFCKLSLGKSQFVKKILFTK